MVTIMNKIIILFLISLVSLVGCKTKPVQEALATDAHFGGIQKLKIFKNGSCYNKNDTFVNLDKMSKIERKRIKFKNSKVFPHVEVTADRIIYSKPQSIFDKNKIYVDQRFIVPAFLKDHLGYEDYLDIELSFVKLNSELYIYWKETYQSKPYHQGLLNYKDGKLTSYCKGQGGAYTTHF